MIRRALVVGLTITAVLLVPVWIVSYFASLEKYVSTDRYCLRLRILEGEFLLDYDGGPEVLAPWQTEFDFAGLAMSADLRNVGWPSLSAKLPLWMPFALLCACPVIVGVRGELRRRRRSRLGLCRRCGYDLTGNVTGRCPECGWDLPSGAQGTRSAKPEPADSAA